MYVQCTLVLWSLCSCFLQSTVRSLVGSLRISMDTKEEGLHRTNSTKKQVDSDSSGYGTFGLVEIAPDQLNCIEKIGEQIKCLLKHCTVCLRVLICLLYVYMYMYM